MVDEPNNLDEAPISETVDHGLRRRLIHWVAVFGGLTSPFLTATLVTNPNGLPGIIAGIVFTVWCLSILPQLKLGVSSRACTLQLLGGLIACLSVISFCTGGIPAPSTVWIAVAPALGLTMDGKKVAAWTGLMAAAFVIGLGAMTYLGWVYPVDSSENVVTIKMTLNVVFMTVLLVLLVRVGEQMSRNSKAALHVSNRTLRQEIQEHQETRNRLNRAHQELVSAAHAAGAAQVATGILHNLGNALNAVQVSTGLAESRLTSMRLSRVEALADLIEPQVEPKITRYAQLLITDLQSSRAELRDELGGIREAVEHANAIVATQQRHAVRTSVAERLEISEVVADALSLCWRADTSTFVDVRCAELPMAIVDRHRVLQIVTNLISNAFDACRSVDNGSIQIEAYVGDDDALVIRVTDTGVGIGPDAMERIFSHGFTTRPDGHGFGLHASALAAQELGGSLSTHSDGLGKGAQFTLSIPVCWTPDEASVAAGG